MSSDAGYAFARDHEEHGQQAGLTQAAALNRLRDLGVSDLGAVRAIELARETGAAGNVIVDGNLVSFADGYGWAVSPAAGPVLDQENTREELRRLGYPEGAIRQAIEHAPFTRPGDGPSFLSRHSVVSADGGGYRITGHPRRVRWPDLGSGHDVDAILAAIEIVDRHLDEAAPEVFRQDNEASRLLNRFRRIAAGPASEGQEAVDALNLLTGGNPRKGVTGTEDDLLMELGDTVSSALFAIQSITKDTDATWAVFIAALAKALGRVPGERPAPSFTHFPPESGMDDQAAQENGITG